MLQRMLLFSTLISSLSCQLPVPIYLSPQVAQQGSTRGIKCYKDDVENGDHMRRIYCPRNKDEYCLKMTLEYENGKTAILRDCSSDLGSSYTMRKGCFGLVSKAPVKKTFACFCQRNFCNAKGRLVPDGMERVVILLCLCIFFI